MNKPLCLEIEEAKKEIAEAIEQASASHGLPCYLLELIVSDVLSRIQNGKHKELENAKQSYERSKENGE